MTVAELIDKLSKFNPGLLVVYEYDSMVYYQVDPPTIIEAKRVKYCSPGSGEIEYEFLPWGDGEGVTLLTLNGGCYGKTFNKINDMETYSFQVVPVDNGDYTGKWNGWQVKIDTTLGLITFGVVHGATAEIDVLVTVNGGRAFVKYNPVV